MSHFRQTCGCRCGCNCYGILKIGNLEIPASHHRFHEEIFANNILFCLVGIGFITTPIYFINQHISRICIVYQGKKWYIPRSTYHEIMRKLGIRKNKPRIFDFLVDSEGHLIKQPDPVPTSKKTII